MQLSFLKDIFSAFCVCVCVCVSVHACMHACVCLLKYKTSFFH